MKKRDKSIEIENVQYDIVDFLDDEGERTTNEAEACTLLLQRPEDQRPDGVQQAYIAVRIIKGSLAKLVSH